MSKPSGDDGNRDDPELKLLGRALAHLRLEHGHTQDTASEALGTSPQNWAKYEKGKAPSLFRPDVQRRLLQAIGADAEGLMLARARLAGEQPPRARPAEIFDFRASRPGGDAAPMAIRHRLHAAWVLDDEGATFGHFHLSRDPRYPQADQYLGEMLDDSAEDLGIRRGDLAHLVAADGINYWPRTGDIVEVERRRDPEERELTLRQVEVTADQVLLWPRSPNPRLREPLTLPIDPATAPEGPRILALLLNTTRRF